MQTEVVHTSTIEETSLIVLFIMNSFYKFLQYLREIYYKLLYSQTAQE